MKNFLIYRSSAGSGKTYALVKEYLKLVLAKPESIRHTLAITFTNKAADEMKSRIISALKNLSESKNEQLLNDLKNEGLEFDLKASSRKVLSTILHNYSYFTVSTIDSFFQRVIKSFSKELNLHIGYDIELDTGIVLDKVVDDVFKDIGDNDDLTKYIVDYVYQNIDEDRGWHVDKNIKSLANEIFRERYQERKLKKEHDIIDNRDRINDFIGQLNKLRYVFENTLIKRADEALEIISANGLDVEDFKGKKISAAGYFLKMSKKDTYSDAFNTFPYASAKKILADGNGWYVKDSLKKSLIEKAVNSGLGKILEDMVSFHEAGFKKYISARIVLKTIYTVGIFSDVIDKLKEYRDDNRILLLPDTNILLRSVINEESSPFVYEKMGEYYSNFLIDEFQDTSTFQWKNVLPLILNSLSEQNFSFVAGDVKQSIYRWRNGNMMLLLRGIENDLKQFRENIDTIDLDKNYRSGKNIIDFNNTLFSTLPGVIAGEAETGDTSLIEQAYEKAAQKPGGNNKDGFIKVEFIEENSENNLSAHEIAGSKLTDTVRELLTEGIQAGDILILARRNEELREISMLFNDAGIQVVSDESLLLINSPKVKFILSILNYLSGSEDKYTKSEALYNLGLIENKPEVNFDKLFRLTDAEFDETISKRLNTINIHNRSLYESTEYIIQSFKLNKSADPYIMRFLDVVLEYSSGKNREDAFFVQWWEENKYKYSVIVPGLSSAVRLMTIHKAKGLESPVVIIPFANWEINIKGSRDLIWVSSSEEPFNTSTAYLVKAAKELKESYFADDYDSEYISTNIDNLNLLYVALTRAKDRLYIISPSAGKSSRNINTVLKKVFNSSDWLKKHKKGENIYEFGKKEIPKKTPYEHDEYKITIREVTSNDFGERILIKPTYEDRAFETEENIRTSRGRGILIHKALSKIISADDLENAITYIKSLGLMNDEYEDELRKELKDIINDKNLTDWFGQGAEIKTEKEIITKTPGKPVVRPDRVLIKGNKIKLLDYKTGNEKEEDKKQIMEYAEILKNAGYDAVETFLYYTVNKKLVNVK